MPISVNIYEATLECSEPSEVTWTSRFERDSDGAVYTLVGGDANIISDTYQLYVTLEETDTGSGIYDRYTVIADGPAGTLTVTAASNGVTYGPVTLVFVPAPA